MAWWLRGLGDIHIPQMWDLSKIPPHGQHGIESRTCRNIHKLPHSKSGPMALGFRYLFFFFGPPLARSALGKGKWLFLNNHTALGRLGSAALVGSQSRRVDNSDSKPTSARSAGQTQCVKTMGPWAHLSIQKLCPSHGSTTPMPPRKILEPEARRRTLQQKTYSFLVATAILAH